MAYQRSNYLQKAAYIIGVYKAIKEVDKPDTRIIKHEFPKYGIFISYRQWMNIKGMKPSEYAANQLNLFAS
jgi:hypothetical protein